MMSRVRVAVVVLAACNGPNHPSEPKVLRPHPTGPLLRGTALGPEELAVEWPDLRIQKLSATETLVCRVDSCVCMVAPDERYRKFDDEVSRYRKSVEAGAYCRSAETARWCQFRVFHEEDSISGEDRWYDDTGEAIGITFSSDVDEYCDQQSNTMWIGKMPDCAMPDTFEVQLLCADPVRPPPRIGDLRRPLRWFDKLE